MLERYAMKVACTVLRGGRGSNASPLPDHRTGGSCAFSGTLCGLKLVPIKWRCLVPLTSG